jgi:hypothetical protein
MLAPPSSETQATQLDKCKVGPNDKLVVVWVPGMFFIGDFFFSTNLYLFFLVSYLLITASCTCRMPSRHGTNANLSLLGANNNEALPAKWAQTTSSVVWAISIHFLLLISYFY